MSTKWNSDPVPGIIHGKWRQEFYRCRRKWTVNFISASTLAECFWNFSPICSHQIALSHERTSLDACKKQIPHTLAMELSFFQLSDPRSELKAILVLSRHNRMDQPSRQDNRESNIFLENNFSHFSHFSLWRLLWRLRNDLLSFRSFDSPILPPESHAEFLTLDSKSDWSIHLPYNLCEEHVWNAHVNNRHKDIERWLEGECLIRQLTQCVQHVILFCQFCLSVFWSAPFVLECEAAPRTLPASMQLHLSSKLSVNYATCCCSQTWPNQASSIKSKTFGSVWYNLIHMHIYKHWYTISPWKNLIPCWGAGNLVVRWPFRHCPDTLCKENMAIIGIAWNCLLAQQCIFCPWPMSYQLIWAWGCTGLPGCCYRFSKARKLDGNRWPQESYK